MRLPAQSITYRRRGPRLSNGPSFWDRFDCHALPIRSLATRRVRLLQYRVCGTDSCRFSWSSALWALSPAAGSSRARSDSPSLPTGPSSQILIVGPSSAGRSATAPRRGLPPHRGPRARPAGRRWMIPRSLRMPTGSPACPAGLACRRQASCPTPPPSAAVPSRAPLLVCPLHSSESHDGS
jgi:hypothetical protein